MILGVDPGAKRVGVAAADEETRFALPVEVIDAGAHDPVTRLLELVEERSVSLIVVGRPTGLSGRAGPAAATASEFAERLRAATSVPVEEYDERLTTVIAERSLRGSGAKTEERGNVRDAVAAQVMLQDFLDARGPA